MIKIEYKKIDYIFSVNNNIEESIMKLNLTTESKTFISNLLDKYNKEIKDSINSYKMDLADKKKLLAEFNSSIPKQLIVLRNHLKMCNYCNSVIEFNYKYKMIEEDFKRLSIIK